jgi:hypothetical protein
MEDLLKGLLGSLGTAGGLGLAKEAYDELGLIGERGYAEMAGPDGLAQELRGMLEFQPYTVTSATGGQFGMRRDPTTGEMMYELQTSPEEQELQQQQLQRAGTFFEQAATPVTDREQQVYERMRAAMTPERVCLAAHQNNLRWHKHKKKLKIEQF